jgi:diguanylate cyclase (GGDEF)-like protein
MEDSNRNEPSPRERHQLLEQLASTDPTTGLLNRRGAHPLISRELARAERHRTPLSCALFDIDQFIDFNLAHGHVAGDRLLRDVGALLARSVSGDDIVLRVGGDEFLIVVPGADLEQARQIAAGIISAATITIPSIALTAGVATANSNYDFEAMFREADAQLYRSRSKRSGSEGDLDSPVREPKRRGPDDGISVPRSMNPTEARPRSRICCGLRQ